MLFMKVCFALAAAPLFPKLLPKRVVYNPLRSARKSIFCAMSAVKRSSCQLTTTTLSRERDTIRIRSSIQVTRLSFLEGQRNASEEISAEQNVLGNNTVGPPHRQPSTPFGRQKVHSLSGC